MQRQRERFRVERAARLAVVVDEHESRGDIPAAIALNRRVLELVPLQDVGWRKQMRLHFRLGDRVAALDDFDRFEALLRDGPGGQPHPQTRELRDEIERAPAIAPSPGERPPRVLQRPPVLVGRRRQWGEMAQAWESGAAFLLVGEGGIGKTRLLGDFLSTRPGCVVASGHAGDAGHPYAVLGRLLRSVIDSVDVSPALALRRELARIVPSLGSVPTSAGEQSLLWDAVEALLAAAVAAGLAAIAVDDLQFADLASVEALRWLATRPRLRPLRWACAARPDPASAAAACLDGWRASASTIVTITLPPWSVAEVESLLASLALAGLDRPGLATRLVERAGGHPLYTLEVLKAVVCGGSQGLDLPVPQNLQALLDQRLHDLSDPAGELLCVAAVCGEDLTLDRAAELCGRPMTALERLLAELEAAHLLNGLRFTNDLVRDSALRRVPKAFRAALHGRFAQLLAQRRAAPAARLAAHFEAAEFWRDAGCAWQTAAAEARVAARMVEQGTLQQRALHCFERAGDAAGQFDALVGMLESRIIESGPDAVLAEWPRLDALASTPIQRTRAALVRTEALLNLWRHEEAAACAAAAVAQAREVPSLRVDALNLQSLAMSQAGRWTEAIACQRQAVSLLTPGADHEQVLRAYSALAWVLGQDGRYGQAEAAQRRALEAARAGAAGPEVVLCESNLAAIVLRNGHVDEAHRLARGAAGQRHLLGPQSNSAHGGLALLTQGCCAAYRGHYDEAIDSLLQARRLLGDRSAPMARVQAGHYLAMTWLTLGRVDLAAAELLDDASGASPVWIAVRRAMVARVAAAQDRGGVDDPARSRSDERDPAVADHPTFWLESGGWTDSAAAVARLRDLESRCRADGVFGVARALALAGLERRLEVPGSPPADAAALARELRPHVDRGLHVSCYVPRAWLTLAETFDRAGDGNAAVACREDALRWVEQALPRVPAEQRAAFVRNNPTNRLLSPPGR